MAINLNGSARKAASNLAVAFTGDDTAAVEEAFIEMQMAISESVAQEYRDAIASNDRAILAQRGFRQLTTEETDYYQSILDAMGSANPKQAFADITKNSDNTIPEKMMPETIFNEILKNLTERHPLLDIIRPKNVGYITTWLRNKHTRQLAVWGDIETDITGEITSAFEVVSVRQGRLTCFMLIHRDTLELGPEFLDGYIRTVLAEAMACGMEAGVCSGSGVNGEPIGLDRDVSKGVNVNQETGYPRKTPIEVTSFTPAEYGPLVAILSKDEKGHVKSSVDGLTLVCNLTDYLTKVMPATTLLNTSGAYVRDLFPIPTRVVTAEVIKDGEAILFLPDEYDLLLAGNRGIEYSDEVKFFEDKRAAKMVTYAFGEAKDDTCAILLDISGLEPSYVNVRSIEGTPQTPPAIDSAVVTAENAATVLYGHTVSDLQTGITVANGAITGTLKKVTSGALARDWGEGYFIALKWTVDSDANSLKVGMYPSKSSGLIECIGDSDRNGVFKVTNKDAQKFKIITKVDGWPKTQLFDLSGLVFED